MSHLHTPDPQLRAFVRLAHQNAGPNVQRFDPRSGLPIEKRTRGTDVPKRRKAKRKLTLFGTFQPLAVHCRCEQRDNEEYQQDALHFLAMRRLITELARRSS